MKTILYQPLFTNPQAYFVFPQLYHIEKGDSYIEPANITGQLIIQSLSCNTKPTEDNSILLIEVLYLLSYYIIIKYKYITTNAIYQRKQ